MAKPEDIGWEVKDNDPIADKLNASWRRNIRTIDKHLRDGRLDPERFQNPLHEVRFYLDQGEL